MKTAEAIYVNRIQFLTDVFAQYKKISIFEQKRTCTDIDYQDFGLSPHIKHTTS